MGWKQRVINSGLFFYTNYHKVRKKNALNDGHCPQRNHSSLDRILWPNS